MRKDTDIVNADDAKVGSQARRGPSFQHHHGVLFSEPTDRSTVEDSTVENLTLTHVKLL